MDQKKLIRTQLLILISTERDLPRESHPNAKLV